MMFSKFRQLEIIDKIIFGLTSASMFALLYVLYRDFIFFESTRHESYLKYYYILFFCVFFWSALLRLKRSYKINILVITFSSVIGIYLSEIILSVSKKINKKEDISLIAKSFNVYFDPRSKKEVVIDLKKQFGSAAPHIAPSNFISPSNINLNSKANLFPLSGISKTHTVGDNESGTYQIYLSDRYGFNNPDEEWDSKNVEFLLIGDSFTLGSAVEPGKEISGQLREISNKPVINLGMGGNGPLIELASLIEYGKILKPNNVLWFFYEGNDLSSNISSEMEDPILMSYLEGDYYQDLTKKQVLIDQKLEKIIGLKMKENTNSESHFAITNFLKLYNLRELFGSLMQNDKDIEIRLNLLSRILSKAKNVVDDWGGELHFIFLPEYSRYDKRNVSLANYKNKQDILNLVEELNIQLIDIDSDFFRSIKDPYSLFPFRSSSAHYSENAYKLISKKIFEFLQLN